MWEDHNTFDKPYRKCAKAVGDVMGKYHPHGDSSIYGAMIYMSQKWKMREPFIDIHGNNGSIDGDGPAAYRYTECRLTPLAEVMLKDINKNGIEMTLNYSDEDLEPTVLPANFPNLLVNGSTGISAGYATNIPPHNLGEVIDATIHRIKNPNCRLDTILSFIKGPDFPTGGVLEGKDGLVQAYTTGKGRVVLKAKTEIVKEKGKFQIIVHEIPYEVLKEQLRKKIEDIKIDKKVEGIADVFDISDNEHMGKMIIELKKDANAELILNNLYKNTELQVGYNFNIVAIDNRRPKQLGLLSILDSFIAHQKEVVTRRTKFDLDHAKARYHIVEGLIKCISILDEVIKVIRASKNKADAKENLVKKFGFTEKQAEAILVLQLYRLTNMDVIELQTEFGNLERVIAGLKAILADEEKLKYVMKEELKAVKKEYATPRKTEIVDEVEEIKIDTTEMIAKEDCMVVVTSDGYVKRTSLRSYNKEELPLVKEGDFVTGTYQMNTLDTLLLFTDLGNYLYIPVYELPEAKWKEMGKHVSNVIKIGEDENIIDSLPVYDFNDGSYITMFTRDGMVKRTSLSEFKVSRYSKPIICMKLKDDDKVVTVTNDPGKEVFITTKNGYGLRYNVDEISEVGLRASGVKAISLKNDEVVCASIFDELDYLSVITDKGTGKRIKLTEFETISRAKKGVLMVRDVKTNPYHILRTFIVPSKNVISIKIGNDFKQVKLTELPITDRYSTGTVISKSTIDKVFLNKDVVTSSSKNEKPVEDIKEEVNLKTIDEKILTIDDFLDDFKIKG